MFHNTTTIHRMNRESAFTGRENRMVNYSMKEFKMDWFKTKYFGRGLKKWAGRASWIFGGPIIMKGLSLGAKGVSAVAKGAEWTYETAAEGAKGIKDMTLKPMFTLGTAVADDIKRTRFWEVPKASLVAMFRTPMAALLSPYNFLVKGVRASIASIPNNAKDIWNNFTSFKPIETMRSTRNLIWDVLKNPVTHTLGPILKPLAEVGKEIGRAKWSYVKGTRQAMDDVVGGFNRIKNAPHLATENLHRNLAEREMLKNEKIATQLEERNKELAEIGVEPEKGTGQAGNVIDLASRRKQKSGGGASGIDMANAA